MERRHQSFFVAITGPHFALEIGGNHFQPRESNV
jgi:hypothetical protein